MPIPSEKDIRIPLLHLINDLGGEVKPVQTYAILADYFMLTEEEQEELLPSGRNKKFGNRIQWARLTLRDMGLLDGTIYGVWKITEKGRKELSRLGLLNKPFPKRNIPDITREAKSDDSNKDRLEISKREKILEEVLEKIAPDGKKKFPDDFLETKCISFYELELPGTQLYLTPLSDRIITSPKGYFRYQAKNPPEARYILYAHNLGMKKIRIPKDNFVLFKAVKSYEKYCDEVIWQAFDAFFEITNDEEEAENLTKEIEKKLDLRIIKDKRRE